MKAQAVTVSQLARMYSVDRRTMASWLKPHAEKIGKPTGKLYNPAQLQIIYQCIGMPG